MKILIIEDEYSLADAIAETLKKENFTPNIITNGEKGENEALSLEQFVEAIYQNKSEICYFKTK